MKLRTVSLASLALSTVAIVPSGAAAQSCVSQGTCNISPKESSLLVGGKSGYRTQVWISVLGGAAANALQLFHFASPFDPSTGMFSEKSALASKVAIGPAKSAGKGSQPWVAPKNRTLLGLFNPGDEIYLGILANNKQWFFSGATSVTRKDFAMMNRFGTAPVHADNRRDVLHGTGAGDVYGFEDMGGSFKKSDRDFNDLVFSVHQSTVTPEPATMVLLGTGLAGVAGAARRRRRKRDA